MNKRRYKVRNIAMVEAFANAVHDAEQGTLREQVKRSAERTIKRMRL